MKQPTIFRQLEQMPQDALISAVLRLMDRVHADHPGVTGDSIENFIQSAMHEAAKDKVRDFVERAKAERPQVLVGRRVANVIATAIVGVAATALAVDIVLLLIKWGITLAQTIGKAI